MTYYVYFNKLYKYLSFFFKLTQIAQPIIGKNVKFDVIRLYGNVDCLISLREDILEFQREGGKRGIILRNVLESK